MNYRHIYHAGNFADVFKHVVLMLVVEHLRKKDKPFFALDTHAGIGTYDLTSEQAVKTGEAGEGIARIFALDKAEMPDILRRYLDIVRLYNAGSTLTAYPGSPMIVRDMLRAQDRLVVNELHTQDVQVLRHVMNRDERVKVEHMDGYQALKAYLPPVERRGVVLIDPPFEERNEFEMMADGLKQAYKRWATGTYALWYPIKAEADISAFHQTIKMLGIPDCKAFDFYLRQPVDGNALNGCGMMFVNAPWTLQEDIAALAPFLVQHLTAGQGRIQAQILTAEQ